MANAKTSPDSAGRTAGGRFVGATFGILVMIVSSAYYLSMLQAGKHGPNAATIIALAFWLWIGFMFVRSAIRKAPVKP
jgi:hypothetical protein